MILMCPYLQYSMNGGMNIYLRSRQPSVCFVHVNCRIMFGLDP